MHNILYEVLLQKVDYFMHAPSKHVTVYSYHQYTFDVCLTLRRLLPLNLIFVHVLHGASQTSSPSAALGKLIGTFSASMATSMLSSIFLFISPSLAIMMSHCFNHLKLIILYILSGPHCVSVCVCVCIFCVNAACCDGDLT